VSRVPKTLEKYILFVNGKRKEVFEAPDAYSAQRKGLGILGGRVGKAVDRRGRPSR